MHGTIGMTHRISRCSIRAKEPINVVVPPLREPCTAPRTESCSMAASKSNSIDGWLAFDVRRNG
jgi:hypothetical protein